MRIAAGSNPQDVDVTWYFVPPTSPFLYPGHAFASSNWDTSVLEGSPDVGERRDAPRTYYTGENAWNYKALCTVGDASAFANGIDPSSTPPAVPACCRDPFPQRWYFRSDLTPPAGSKVPRGWLTNWSNQGDVPVRRVLSPDIGNGQARLMPWGPQVLPPVAAAKGVVQYISPPLPFQSIGSNLWRIILGRQQDNLPPMPNLFWGYNLQWYIMDPKTNAPMVGGNPAFQIQFALQDPAATTFANVFEPIIGLPPIPTGTYFVIEVGPFALQFGPVPNFASGNLVDGGSVPVQVDEEINFNPMTFLEWFL
jgi:hypothetical protein